jgi:hypothetical protein
LSNSFLFIVKWIRSPSWDVHACPNKVSGKSYCASALEVSLDFMQLVRADVALYPSPVKLDSFIA